MKLGDDEMVVFDRNIEKHAKAGHAVFHPPADSGLVNGSDAVLPHLFGGDETIPMQVLSTRHSATQRQSGPKRKGSEQVPETVEEFWNQQDDGWW